jgi:hypothetical protein
MPQPYCCVPREPTTNSRSAERVPLSGCLQPAGEASPKKRAGHFDPPFFSQTSEHDELTIFFNLPR